MLDVHCDSCLSELTEPGGILLGPPDADGKVSKIHLCVECIKPVTRLALTGSAVPNPAPEHMLKDGESGAWCPVDGALAVRREDGLIAIDPGCSWKGHRPSIVALFGAV